MHFRLFLIFFHVCLIAPLLSFAQGRATGLEFNDDAYAQTRMLSPALKFSGADLPSYSLRKYCPTPGDQGNIGSCVGWATGYAALTIADAIRTNNTNTSAITTSARSAMYIYLQIVNSCPQGTFISDALETVKTQGDCLHREFGNGKETCNSSIPSTLRTLAANFKIRDYYTLFDIAAPEQQKITATRNSISANKPVVIGMNLKQSFNNVGSGGYWKPSMAEQNIGGHAMTVIGYDDQQQRFEIMNSWGTAWGDRGFFTMSYADYARLCKYGYQFTLESESPSQTVSLEGTFKFKKLQSGSFTETPVRLSNGVYTIDNVRVNDFFRISTANMLKDNFLYIFSIKPDQSAEILFPTSRRIDAVTIKDIPVIPSDDTRLEIPADEKRGLTTDMPGEDVLCILYAAQELKDIDDIVRKVKNASGDFQSRLQAALGNRLMPSSAISYRANEMGLSAKSSRGFVAPIILKVTVK